MFGKKSQHILNDAFQSYYDLFNRSMIETRRLKNVVIFFQTILSFVLSRKIINIYNDIARKYGNITVKHFRRCCVNGCFFNNSSIAHTH